MPDTAKATEAGPGPVEDGEAARVRPSSRSPDELLGEAQTMPGNRIAIPPDLAEEPKK
jgi:hypothetical protein